MSFNKEELDIMKEAIKEYEYLERNINHEIKEGASMEQLLDYIEINFDVDITNYDLESDFKYIDMNYGNLTCSIVESTKQPCTLSKYISIWNDRVNDILIEIEDINKVRKIVEENK